MTAALALWRRHALAILAGSRLDRIAAPPGVAIPPPAWGAVMDATIVPCNGCRRCCINDAIILHPEHGDDPSAYETVSCTHPLTGRPAHRLASKANGECVYLGSEGCDIHDRSPLICRAYDCRRQYLTMTRAERLECVRRGLMDEDKLSEGRRRANTLTGKERLECFRRRDERRTQP